MMFYSVGFLIVLSYIIVFFVLLYIFKIKWEEKFYIVFFLYYLRVKLRNLLLFLFNRIFCEG